MINGISSYNNSPTFKGMSIKSVQNFIPDISPEMAEKVSTRLNDIIPHDHLEMVLKGSKTLTHSVDLDNGMRITIGEVKYKGNPEPLEKVEFLYDVADMIKKGTVYA